MIKYTYECRASLVPRMTTFSKTLISRVTSTNSPHPSSRWPEREEGFLDMCRPDFEVEAIPLSSVDLPTSTQEDPGSDTIRAVHMRRRRQAVRRAG